MSTIPGPVDRWWQAARPRTLPAAAVPVAIGASLAGRGINVTTTTLSLLVALFLQVGTNYANDYSDGIRGTDEVRVGPFRLTASRLVPAARVKQAAFLCYAVAGVAGAVLASRTTWWFVVIGATAIAAGWLYTGGPKPYGYLGLGELFVLIYFGFVATVGTAFAQHNQMPLHVWWWGLVTGAMACALLEANNLRDIEGDRESGKRTLAARVGRRNGAVLYGVCVLATVLGALYGGVPAVAAVALVVYIPALQIAFSPKAGRELLPLLKLSARAQLATGAFATVWFLVTR
jgi:1,4-dihydroxy-2-naphthoate octaprenyltransferase